MIAPDDELNPFAPPEQSISIELASGIQRAPFQASVFYPSLCRLLLAANFAMGWGEYLFSGGFMPGWLRLFVCTVMGIMAGLWYLQHASRNTLGDARYLAKMIIPPKHCVNLVGIVAAQMLFLLWLLVV